MKRWEPDENRMNQIWKLFLTGVGGVLIILLLAKAVWQSVPDISGQAVADFLGRRGMGAMEWLWAQSYPSASKHRSGVGTGGDEGSTWARRCMDFFVLQSPVYQYLEDMGERKEDVYVEPDPSYRTYQKNREFYVEHSYLFRYGDEGTGMSAAQYAALGGENGLNGSGEQAGGMGALAGDGGSAAPGQAGGEANLSNGGAAGQAGGGVAGSSGEVSGPAGNSGGAAEPAGISGGAEGYEGQGAQPGPAPAGCQPAGWENPADPANTPAYAVRAGLPLTGARYVREQLADYDYLMKHFYSVHTSATAGRDLMDAGKFLDEDFTLTTGPDQPQILIYHTHSQETFADFGPENPDGTVVGIGDYLTELLQEKGYNVIHDTSVYDLRGETLDRNKAYTYALEGVTSILQKYPSIEVILDVHRDGVNSGVHLVSEVNGKPTAPIMFFNGVSRTPDGPIEYLPNPYLEDNLAFSLQMQLDAAAYYPGFTRKIYIKGLRYNLHLRPRSALIEVGAQTNTYEEAKNAMEPLAQLLDMVLQGN